MTPSAAPARSHGAAEGGKPVHFICLGGISMDIHRTGDGNASVRATRPTRDAYLGGLDNLGGGGDVHDGGHLDVWLCALKVTERVGMARRSADRRPRTNEGAVSGLPGLICLLFFAGKGKGRSTSFVSIPRASSVSKRTRFRTSGIFSFLYSIPRRDPRLDS